MLDETPNYDNISNYNITNSIGEGNFGEVKLAVFKPTGEEFAVKIIGKKILKKKMKDTVFRELDIITKFNHINIAFIYSIIEDQNNFYIIMEYCPNGELFDYIVKKTRLKEKEAAHLFYQLINGVEYIHSKGVAHRDLKPENLLLSKNNILKIIDFGLSHECEEEEMLKTKCGSPSYAAPEIIQGKSYKGYMIDIWCCGIILYGMLCGYLPFEGENNKQLFQCILECDPEYPDILSENSKELIKMILKRDPEKRISLESIKNTNFYKMGKYFCETPLFKRLKMEIKVRKYRGKNKKFISNDNTDENINNYKVIKKIFDDRKFSDNNDNNINNSYNNNKNNNKNKDINNYKDKANHTEDVMDNDKKEVKKFKRVPYGYYKKLLLMDYHSSEKEKENRIYRTLQTNINFKRKNTYSTKDNSNNNDSNSNNNDSDINKDEDNIKYYKNNLYNQYNLFKKNKYNNDKYPNKRNQYNINTIHTISNTVNNIYNNNSLNNTNNTKNINKFIYNKLNPIDRVKIINHIRYASNNNRNKRLFSNDYEKGIFNQANTTLNTSNVQYNNITININNINYKKKINNTTESEKDKTKKNNIKKTLLFDKYNKNSRNKFMVIKNIFRNNNNLNKLNTIINPIFLQQKKNKQLLPLLLK